MDKKRKMRKFKTYYEELSFHLRGKARLPKGETVLSLLGREPAPRQK